MKYAQGTRGIPLIVIGVFNPEVCHKVQNRNEYPVHVSDKKRLYMIPSAQPTDMIHYSVSQDVFDQKFGLFWTKSG